MLHVPCVHVLFAQQRSMSMPQASHICVCPLQTVIDAVHVSFAQHGWPAPPHMPHVPLPAHMRPFEQVSPAQHGWPMPPHIAHVPPFMPPTQPRPALH